jgi:large subunit ribosomal protein L9
MKVIFIEDDRVENVSEGYGRNYLIPNRLAIAATGPSLAAVEKRKDKKTAELAGKRTEAEGLAARLSEFEIEIKVDAGEGGKLFGSVTAAGIAEAVRKQAGIEIDRKKVDLRDPIKNTGEYTVPVKLIQDVFAKLKLKVSPR